MVLPLLVVPLVAAAASTGGGVAITAIVPTALAATYGAFFLAKKYFEHNMRSNIKRTSEAFQRYHQMTQAHINKAKDGIDVIQFKLTKVAEAVNAATEETENAVQKLNHGVEALKEVSLNGVNATQLAKEHEIQNELAQTATSIHDLNQAIEQSKIQVEGIGGAAEGFNEAVKDIQRSQILYAQAALRFGHFSEERREVPTRKSNRMSLEEIAALTAELRDDRVLLGVC